MKSHSLDTTGWQEFQFSVDGVNFISKISQTSDFLPKIAMLPAGVFEVMNINTIRELIEDLSDTDAIITRLQEVNADASHAVIELA